MTKTVDILGKYDDLRNDLIWTLIKYNEEVDAISRELHNISTKNDDAKMIATELLHIVCTDDANLDFIIPTELKLNHFRDKWFGKC